MTKIKIIQISDIHFEKNQPENNGLVLNAFFDDLKSEFCDSDNTFCVINGDLVNKGTANEYEQFYESFIKKLVEYIPLKNIICNPGNHDFKRSIIENNFNNHQTIADGNYNESDFNDLVKKGKDNILQNKFDEYIAFCKNKLFKSNCNHYGFSERVAPEVSIFCLNSALLSYGGYKDINDNGILKIETSSLNEWIQNEIGRTKILLLHHPIEYLTEYYQKEIKSMLRKRDINIVITGHVHDQEIYHISNNDYISCIAPQFFSDKTELNGYAIYEFEGGVLVNIKYRQWVQRQRKFMAGQAFSGEDTGIITFNNSKNNNIDDGVLSILESEINTAMRSYSINPIWSHRYLSTCAPNNISKEKEKQLDYIDIINSHDNYQIIAPPQFGLTCYARYIAKKSWTLNKQLLIYLDCSNIRLSSIESEIKNAIESYKVQVCDIKGFLLDNWRKSIKEPEKILSKIRQNYPDKVINIFSNYDDTIVLKGIDSEESHIGFKQLYLRELNRSAIRTIVKGFNDNDYISEESIVLDRVCLDITDLNFHRTPLNCIQLLLSFKKNFNNRPINRSKVFSYILQLIFNNPGKLFYGSVIDEDDCSYVIGYFCEYLIKGHKESFEEKEFLDETTSFSKDNFVTTNLPDLLQILKNNQIIVVGYDNKLRFRFSCWIYYFAADRMRLNPEFAEYMFSKDHSIYNSDIIEFYTGTDGARKDAIDVLNKELDKLSVVVHKKIGLKDDINPYEHIKWQLNEVKNGITEEHLEENIRKSKLPNEIKDSIADKNYNSIMPYNQTIFNYMEEFELKNLMELTRSASRALRNSLYITPSEKELLSNNIYKAWKEIFRGLFLIAPIMAKTGFAGVGGANFKLTENFPKDYSECLIKIIISMPYNIVLWYKDDVYSDKLTKLFEAYLIECNNDPIVRHTIALLLCYCKPDNWDKLLTKYIDSIHKNSYYLGDLYSNLRNIYALQSVSPKELSQTEKIIKICWAKHNIGSKAIGKSSISKVADNVLPQRNSSIIEE
ncbi:MAG: metallophosphoesterase [Bacteroidia bacterium]|nr:metallophosphoesterase [Bacteroidia bacterium]